MAASFPYVNGPGPFRKFLQKLRTNFPQTVTVDTLKKLGLASQNESYVINVLQILGFIDANGARQAEATRHFITDDAVYREGMEEAVRRAYAPLFNDHGDTAWTLEKSELITYFRMSDGTSEIVGGRQTGTFEVLAVEAGKRTPTVPARAASNGTRQTHNTARRAGAGKERTGRTSVVAPPPPYKADGGSTEFGLALRVELNLPATDDPKIYDALFKSLRENLIDPYRAK